MSVIKIPNACDVLCLVIRSCLTQRRQWDPTPYSCLENPMDGGAWSNYFYVFSSFLVMYNRRVFSVSYSALKVSDLILIRVRSFPRGSDGKESACSAGDLGSIPGLGRSPREGNGNRLQYSCQENSVDRGAWRATVYGVAKSRT